MTALLGTMVGPRAFVEVFFWYGLHQPPNHQLQWTPPEFLDSNGLQWVYIENIQEVLTTELLCSSKPLLPLMNATAQHVSL